VRRGLVRQQPALDAGQKALRCVREAPQCATRPDDAMAGNHHRQWVGAAGRADGTRRGADATRYFAIAQRVADRDLLHHRPHRVLVCAAAGSQRQIEAVPGIAQVGVDLACGFGRQ